MSKNKLRSKTDNFRNIFSYIAYQGGLREYLPQPWEMISNNYIETIFALSQKEKEEIYSDFFSFSWTVVSQIHRAKAKINEAGREYLSIHRFYDLLNNEDNLTEEEKQNLEFLKNKVKRKGIVFKFPSDGFTYFNRYIRILTQIIEDYLALKKFIIVFLRKYGIEDIFTVDIFEIWEENYNGTFIKNKLFVVENQEFYFQIPDFNEIANFLNVQLFKELLSYVNITEEGEKPFKELVKQV